MTLKIVVWDADTDVSHTLDGLGRMRASPRVHHHPSGANFYSTGLQLNASVWTSTATALANVAHYQEESHEWEVDVSHTISTVVLAG